MTKQVKIWSVITSSLFVISVLVFINEHRRGTGIIEGSDFIKGLDVDKISKLVIFGEKKENIAFVRTRDLFVIENYHNYPASSKKINDLLYRISSIQVADMITNNKEQHKVLKVAIDDFKYHIVAYGRNNKTLFDFYVGDTYKIRGNYLRMAQDDQVYLGMTGVYLNTDKLSYFEKELFKLDPKNIQEVAIRTPKNKFELIKKDDKEYQIKNKKGKFDKEKINSFIKTLTKIDLKEAYPYDGINTPNELKSLKFDKSCDITLSNKIVYKLQFANRDEKYYLKLMTSLDESGQKNYVISKNDGKEKLQGIADLMTAQKIANYQNLKHGQWLYMVSKADYEKFVKDMKHFKKI